MPAKNLFKRDTLLEAAFKIVRTKGWERLSARSLAKELNCSTMPIYSYIKSMKRLEKELGKKAINLLLTYQTTKRTEQAFFDMGLGYVLFAKEEKNLFRFLFGRGTGGGKYWNRRSILKEFAFKTLIEKMRGDPLFEGFDGESLNNILTKMWIFVHGLAVLINNNAFASASDDDLQALLKETGRFIVKGEKSKNEMDKKSL
jgi:AcrR family transcriptional regulator